MFNREGKFRAGDKGVDKLRIVNVFWVFSDTILKVYRQMLDVLSIFLEYPDA